MAIVAAPPKGITRAFAEYTAALGPGDVPPATLERAKKAVLDLLGIAVRASQEGGSSAMVRRVVDDLGGAGTATAVGIGPRYQPHYAALLNATFAHTLDFDDTHEGSSLHPGATVIPAALAMAEGAHASGAQLLTAIVAGYDVTVRLSEAATAASQYGRGFHPTATCGTFGATAAIANLLGADAEVVEHAFGINGSQAAGSLQFLENGSWNKRLHTGLAAHNAVLAYRFAAAGMVGSKHAIEGKHGYLHAYSGSSDPARATQSLGAAFAIDETGFKPYPSCRYSHAALDVLCELAREPRFDVARVQRVRIGLPHAGLTIIGIPEAVKRRAASIVEGQFSMFFLAAVALARGRFAWSDYDLLGDPRIAALTERIEVVEDPQIEARYPTMGASVEITVDGHTTRRVNWTPKGEPDNTLTWDEVAAKFDGLADAVYPSSRRARIVAAVAELDRARDVGELTSLLGAPGVPPA